MDLIMMAELKEKNDKKTIQAVAHDLAKSAKAADLFYPTKDQLGFLSKHIRKSFSFFSGTKKKAGKIDRKKI